MYQINNMLGNVKYSNEAITNKGYRKLFCTKRKQNKKKEREKKTPSYKHTNTTVLILDVVYVKQ